MTVVTFIPSILLIMFIWSYLQGLQCAGMQQCGYTLQQNNAKMGTFTAATLNGRYHSHIRTLNMRLQPAAGWLSLA